MQKYHPTHPMRSSEVGRTGSRQAQKKLKANSHCGVHCAAGCHRAIENKLTPPESALGIMSVSISRVLADGMAASSPRISRRWR